MSVSTHGGFSGRQLYFEKKAYLDSSGFPLVEPLDFYRDLFPVGSFERKGVESDQRGNGVIFHHNPTDKRRIHHDLIFDDLEVLKQHFGKPNIIVSPCSYFGSSKKNDNAHECFAIAIDIDEVGAKELRDLIYQAQNDILVMPSYIVNSGGGIHVYYIFNRPIPMYPKNRQFLKDLKTALTERVWNGYTSRIKAENRQYQGIVQGFRAVGTVSKYGNDCIVQAYKTGEKIDVDTLVNSLPFQPYFENSKRVAKSAQRCRELFNDPNYIKSLLSALSKSDLNVTLEEAKVLWKDWYEARIEQGLPRGGWIAHERVYYWWLNRLKTEITVGHRYNGILTLAIYAKKCNISEEQLRADAQSLFEYYDSLSRDESERFLQSDLEAALSVKTMDLQRITTKEISRLSAIQITPKIKRNTGKQKHKQKEHLQLARAKKKSLIDIGDESAKGGRPSKEFMIRLYVKQNPGEKNRTKIAKELGINRDTVAKWMKIIENEGLENG